jgi:hypothetical protein
VLNAIPDALSVGIVSSRTQATELVKEN